MARLSTTRHVPALLDSARKRLSLPPRRDPYWQPCGARRGGLSLGYRKRAKGNGAWVVRSIVDGVRREARLGEADDDKAHGTLSYASAVSLALDRGRVFRAEQAWEKHASSPVTVGDAVKSYTNYRISRHPRNGRDAETRLARHLLAPEKGMVGRSLASLTSSHWKAWLADLTGLQPVSVRRLLNDVRAAMQRAAEEHHQALPPGWGATVTRGLKGIDGWTPHAIQPAARSRALLDPADIDKLVTAAFEVDDDFGFLVLVLAKTGARFSQIARMTVADVVGLPVPRLMVPVSRKGGRQNSRRQAITCEIGQDVLDLLQPIVAHRRGDDTLLMRWHHEQVARNEGDGGASGWRRRERRPWEVAAQMSRNWKATLAKAGLTAGIEPYRLRDASIIHLLISGIDPTTVAKDHDTSIKMIESHYAQHIQSAATRQVRACILPTRVTRPMPRSEAAG